MLQPTIALKHSPQLLTLTGVKACGHAYPAAFNAYDEPVKLALNSLALCSIGLHILNGKGQADPQV